MASFDGVDFLERRVGSMLKQFDATANIDRQPTGDEINFDVGNPGPQILSLDIRCNQSAINSLRNKAREGTQATLSFDLESRTALLTAVTNVQRYKPDFNEWFATLTFEAP